MLDSNYYYKNIRRQIVLFLLVSILLLPFVSFASQKLSTSSIVSLAYFIDSSDTYTLENIHDKTVDFTSLKEPFLFLGEHSYTTWIALELKGERKVEKILEIDNATLNSVNLYKLENNKWVVKKSGFNIPVDERELKSKNTTFKVRLDTIPQLYYLAIKSDYPLKIPIELLSEKEWLKKDFTSTMILIAYYAAMFVMLIISLINYFNLKDKIYLFYASFIILMSLGISSISGIGNVYYWGNFPLIQHYSSPFLIFISVFVVNAFVRRLLLASKYTPKLNLIIYIIQFVGLGSILLLPFISIKSANLIANTLNFTSIIILTIVGIYALIYKHKAAIYYFIGFIGLGGAVVITTLDFHGVLNLNYGFLALCIGSSWEAFFFMISMGVRVKTIREERSELKTQLETIKNELRNNNKEKTEELPDYLKTLSQREKEVLYEISLGLTDKEISEKLFISIPTVKTHARNIYSKLLAKNRTEAIFIAKRYGVLRKG